MSCRQKERWVLSSELQPNLWNLQLPMLIFGHTLCRNKGPRTAASPRRASLHFPKFLMLLLLLLFHLRYTLVIITHHFQDLKTNNLLYLVLVLLVSWVHECICCRHPPSFHPALRHKGTIGGPTVSAAQCCHCPNTLPDRVASQALAINPRSLQIILVLLIELKHASQIPCIYWLVPSNSGTSPLNTSG